MDAKSSKRGQVFTNKTWLFVKLFLALDFSLFLWNGIEKHVKMFLWRLCSRTPIYSSFHHSFSRQTKQGGVK